MSHRKPATRADKYFDAIDAIYGSMGLSSGPINLASDLSIEVLTRCVERGHAAENSVEHVLGLRRPVGTPSTPDLALWSRWRTCRHVYRFDRELSRELCNTPLPDKMPLDSLRMMPYPICYIDATLPAIGAHAVGAFVWVDKVAEGEVFSVVLLLDDGASSQGGALRMYEGTLGNAVSSSVTYDAEFAMKFCRTSPDLLVGGSYHDMSHAMYAAILNHLLYIVSDATDQRVEYRPGGGGKRRKGQTSSTIHSVGEVTGRALGSARVSYVGGTSSTTGRSVRPHVRAAHFHHYWTGPRDMPEKRKLIVHWIPPVFVGSGGTTPTTIHKT